MKKELIKKLDLIDNQLSNINESISLILELTYDKDEDVRMKAYESLLYIRNDEIEKRMRNGATDSDEFVRITCIEALGIWKDFSASELLLKILSDDESSLVRTEAAITLSIIGEKKATNIIKNKLKNSGDEEKHKYYLALYKLGEKNYYNKFLEGLSNNFYRIRCATANLIHEVVNKTNKTSIIAMLENALLIENTKAAKSSINEAIENIKRI